MDIRFYAPDAVSLETRRLAMDFWTAHGVLSKEAAEQRSSQVIAQVHEGGKLVAISTGFVALSVLLQQPMFAYRCFVAEEFRQRGIATQLLHTCFQRLEQHYLVDANPSAIGVLLEIPDPVARLLNQKLLWPDSQFAFIGKTESGAHVRVRYFDQVKIKPQQEAADA